MISKHGFVKMANVSILSLLSFSAEGQTLTCHAVEFLNMNKTEWINSKFTNSTVKYS
jgi:hypothetical protein